MRDAAGRVTKVVGALSDITERKLEEISLRRARDEAREALGQQSAVSEILRVMSRSPTDTQPVFDLLAQRAGKLCKAEVAVVSRKDGERIELAAIDGVSADAVRIVRGLYPMDVQAESVTARVIRSAQVVHVDDVLADPHYALKSFAQAARFRACSGRSTTSRPNTCATSSSPAGTCCHSSTPPSPSRSPWRAAPELRRKTTRQKRPLELAVRGASR